MDKEALRLLIEDFFLEPEHDYFYYDYFPTAIVADELSDRIIDHIKEILNG